MLKEVSETGLATHLVSATHAEPRLKTDHGRALVFKRQHGQAVRQLPSPERGTRSKSLFSDEAKSST